jgi:hypothetical protein
VEKTLKVLNKPEKKGLIERYAIGGGIAVHMLYLENVLESHGLQKKWHKFTRPYDEE